MLDALELVEGLRGGGNDEPTIVLGTAPSAQMAALAYEVGADAYCCVAETTTRSLLWTFARAIDAANWSVSIAGWCRTSSSVWRMNIRKRSGC